LSSCTLYIFYLSIPTFNMIFAFDVDKDENDAGVDIDVDEEDEEDEDEDSEAKSAFHDQLPTVEEIKIRSHFDKGIQRRQRQYIPKKWELWLILGGILFVGVFIWGGLIIWKRHQYQKAVISITKTIRLSHPDAFDGLESPQSQALQWMVNIDPLRLPLPVNRDDPFVQRYIAALFIFAVAPSSQTRKKFNLLSANHECRWNSKWNRLDDYNNKIDVDTKGIELGFICGIKNNRQNDNDDSHRNAKQNDNKKYESDDHNKISNDIKKDVMGFDEEGIETSITAIILPKAGLEGILPPEMMALKYLVRVDLDGNKIQGKVPAMPFLTYLSLAYNELTGYMPDHFSEMTRLQTLCLSENALQGTLPKNLAALIDLKILALNGNELTGGLVEVYDLTRLEELHVSYNSFEDQLSNYSFQKLSNLKVIDMKSNRISGPLPDSLWELTNLEVIDFHHNALNGYINDIIVSDHQLKYLDVSSNILSGGIPPSISNLQALTHMDVSYNRFNKKLPNYLSNLTKMRTLLLTEDDDFGPQPLPDWIRGMTDLEQLSFRLTSRTGTIPTWFGELTHLQLLDLDWNHISGTIPTQLSQLTNLKYLMLNRNKMIGEIPYEVSSLPKLKMLMVDNNSFTGELKLEVGTGTCPDHKTQVTADCGNPEYGCPDCDNATQKIACPCCSRCCYESQQRCNMDDHLIEIEYEYRNSYDRYRYYTFDDNFPYQYVPAI